jgi:hypothetical protein
MPAKFDVLAVDRDQPPPACQRCSALPGPGPQRYPLTPVRRPTLNILRMTLPTPAPPPPCDGRTWTPHCAPTSDYLL